MQRLIEQPCHCVQYCRYFVCVMKVVKFATDTEVFTRLLHYGCKKGTYLLTYLLTHSLHGAGYSLKS